MKKRRAFLLALALVGTRIAPLSHTRLLKMNSIEASASYTYGDFEYCVLGKELYISAYNGRGGEVRIPNEINGKKVTAIGTNAFKGNKNITSVVMGDYITSIDDYAFNNCTNLKTITLSPVLSTKESGGYLFNGCDALKTVNVPYEMQDKFFIFHFQYLSCFSDLMRTVIDKRVETVYNELMNRNPDLPWNIRSLQGAERERAKYEVAKYIHSKFGEKEGTPDVYIEYISGPESGSAYSLVTGKGLCAGMAKAYALLLLKAGFTLDEVDLIAAPAHELVGIKLWDQWYEVECTHNKPIDFAMHNNSEYYIEGTHNGIMKITDIGELYASPDKMYTKRGISYSLNAETNDYINTKYGSADGGIDPSVKEYERGDINMDGSIDSFDIARLRRYLNGSYTNYMNLVNCDFNRDGNIDGADLVAIQNFVIRK